MFPFPSHQKIRIIIINIINIIIINIIIIILVRRSLKKFTLTRK